MIKLKEFLLGIFLLTFAGFSAYGVMARSGNRTPREFETLAPPEYENITHSEIKWESIGKGLDFAKVDVYKKGSLADRIAIVKINPASNKIGVFCSYDERTGNYDSKTIDEWQEATRASVVFNSAQYMAEPWARPCGLVISNGRFVGPTNNISVRGMFLAEPSDSSLPLADLIDSEFEEITPDRYGKYTQGVQHWPIILNRQGRIRVVETDWQANRTVIAKDSDGNILAMTTEGGFFTLYNFARFLKESDLKIHTAMNLDGGYEAEMRIRTPSLDYVTYGQFETYGQDRNATIRGARCPLPSVIAVFPR